MKLEEANYKQVGSIDSSLATDRKSLKVDMINQILGDISDELYTILNKVENIGRIAKLIGYEQANIDVEAITRDLTFTLDTETNPNWETLLIGIEESSQIDD